MPEVEALTSFLRETMVGRVVARVDVAAVSVLKTYDPEPTALGGLEITDVVRRGKFIDVDTDGLHLVVHLSKAGWLRWSDSLSPKPPRPGRGPLALRVHLDDGSGFDLTEAGTRKGLAVYVVHDPDDVPGVQRLGIDPLDPEFTVDRLSEILREAGRGQIKGVLRNQSVIAGIGNAYSDEVLHVARFSPFHPASSFSPAEVETLHAAITGTLDEAIRRSSGKPAKELKDAKRSGMRVHGRTGEECPICGDTVREVSFADSSLQYCPTCQTGGKPLADRRMSRLLR